MPCSSVGPGLEESCSRHSQCFVLRPSSPLLSKLEHRTEPAQRKLDCQLHLAYSAKTSLSHQATKEDQEGQSIRDQEHAGDMRFTVTVTLD